MIVDMSLAIMIPNVRVLLDIRALSKYLYHDETLASVQAIGIPTGPVCYLSAMAALPTDSEHTQEIMASW